MRPTSASISETLTQVGFPPATEVGSLRSIAHLFGSSKPRTGIYALILPDHGVYIGQARDVVRRFAQHRKARERIEAFAFTATRAAELDARERTAIFKAEQAKLLLTNVVHVTDIEGDSDFDAVVSPEAQAAWLKDPFTANHREAMTNSPLELPRAQVLRYADNYRNLLLHENGEAVAAFLSLYLGGSIPFPRATEYSFWSVSCLPSTNSSTWPRYFCLSAGVMELFVVGYYKLAGLNGTMWAFLNVASDVLLTQFGSERKFTKVHREVEIRKLQYRDAGQNQLNLHCLTQGELAELLYDERVLRAAGALALRVMRKRATIYSKFHCKQLADRAFAFQTGEANARAS